jgi:hypothetical protein
MFGNLNSSSWIGFRRLLVSISGAVRQPLSDHALERTAGARFVIDAECHTIAVTEVKFRKIAVQMLLAAAGLFVAEERGTHELKGVEPVRCSA